MAVVVQLDPVAGGGAFGGLVGAALDEAVAYKLRAELPANGLTATVTVGDPPDLTSGQRLLAFIIGTAVGGLVGYLVAS